MATIATLTQKQDGNLEGTLTTLNVTAPIALVPNSRKAKENEPDYRIVSRKNGFEVGAGWNRISKSTGEEYISVSLSAPEFGTIFELFYADTGGCSGGNIIFTRRGWMHTNRPKEAALTSQWTNPRPTCCLSSKWSTRRMNIRSRDS